MTSRLVRPGGDAPVERVVLVGFMASGKTTVGALLAERVGWSHVDLDAMIERERGASVAEIFEREGEPAFRRYEADATRRIARREGVVLTPGGGWAANAELPALLPTAGTFTVWLRVTPAEAIQRAMASGGAGSRPLLRGAAVGERVRALLEEREPAYARADLTIDTDGRTPAELAAELATLLSSST